MQLYTDAVLRCYPPLRIHVWGGLGSQLFAIALASDLSQKYPERRLKIVLHTSGVTKRRPEVCEVFPEFKYLEVDDFSKRERHDSNLKDRSMKTLFRQLMRASAMITGLVAEENDGKSRSAHWWTFSIRGHYSHRKIDVEFLAELKKRLSQLEMFDVSEYLNTAIIHYRLGDLLELKNKNPIPVERILHLVSRLTGNERITVLSDSPKRVLRLIEDFPSGHEYHVQDLTTVQTIWAAMHAKVFVGTSSKISYWVVLLRLHESKGLKNFMPSEDKQILEIIYFKGVKVVYY